MFSKSKILLLFMLMVLLAAACQATPAAGNAALVEREETAVAEPSASPVAVTEAFYGWYLDTIGDRSDGDFTNPLVERLYRESEYLTPDFVAQVDAILDDEAQAVYDPFLQAQDVPERIEVQQPAGDEAETTVVVLRYWGGNPDPTPMTVHLVQENGRWLIDNVTAFEIPVEPLPAEPAPVVEPIVEPESPDTVVRAFYEWYLSYIGDPGTEDFRNPLVERAYRDAPYLTDSFVQHMDEVLDAMFTDGRGGHDPFLCAQDVPSEVQVETMFMNGPTPSVLVTTSFANHFITLDLQQVNEIWLISNITCTDSPAGSAKAFYTWYLGTIGDRSNGTFNNPLADGSYADHPLLSDPFVQAVTDLLAEAEHTAYDPFLLAQDIPYAFSVDPGVAEGTAVIHEIFGPDSVRHLLVTMEQSGSRWLITDVSAAEPIFSGAPAGDSTAAEVVAEDSSAARTIFNNPEYGFSLAYPVDWVLAPMDLDGAGQPDDWPVVAAWQVMPAAVAETLAANTRPDPSAPVIVAPFNVEVVVGDRQALARVYPLPEVTEAAVINGNEAEIVMQEPGYTHYIFPHPTRADHWLVITDWVTIFPGREVQAEVALPALTPLLQSLQFSE